INGNNATILVNTSGVWPEAEVMMFQSTLAATTWSWDGRVRIGDTTFNVKVPNDASGLQAGNRVFIQLGQDPNDINGEQNNIIATVVSNDGNGTLILDEGPPYNIIQQPQFGTLFNGQYQ